MGNTATYHRDLHFDLTIVNLIFGVFEILRRERSKHKSTKDILQKKLDEEFITNSVKFISEINKFRESVETLVHMAGSFLTEEPTREEDIQRINKATYYLFKARDKHFLSINNLLADTDFNEILRLAKKVIELTPENPKPYFICGIAYYYSDQFQLAKSMLIESRRRSNLHHPKELDHLYVLS